MSTEHLSTNEAGFWNDPQNIAWFNTEPAPKYWREFFETAKALGVARVLDLGSGAGRNAQLLFELGYDLYTCDLFDGMVQATSQRLVKAGMDPAEVKLRVAQASMLNLPYQDQAFDAIVSNGVYHNAFNLNELEQALEESSRALRPGGYICFNLFSSNCIATDLNNLGNHVYLTKEGLLMVLTSKDEFLALAGKHKLSLAGEIVEYEREVSTGKRSVMRGVLKKT